MYMYMLHVTSRLIWYMYMYICVQMYMYMYVYVLCVNVVSTRISVCMCSS